MTTCGNGRGVAMTTNGSTKSANCQGLRILVVDDLRDNATTSAMMLKLMGHETLVATDGFEALDAAADFHPDVALLDLGMPRMDGYETARRLRDFAWGTTMLLVAVTGWGREEDKCHSHAAGFDVHLVKPIDFKELEVLLASFQNKLAPLAPATITQGKPLVGTHAD